MSVINPCLTLAVCALSAGVGRTGTFLALDQLLQQMRQEKLVDVFGVVYSLRMNRYQMIQTLVRSLLSLFTPFHWSSQGWQLEELAGQAQHPQAAPQPVTVSSWC